MTGKGLVRHVLIRKGFTTKELMVCLVINGRKIPQVEKLVDRLQKIEGMTAIMANVNTEQTNVILGNPADLGSGLYRRLYRKRQIPHFPAVFLSGQPGTDRKALRKSTGIRRTDR